MEVTNTKGRRKTAIARVYLIEAEGESKITVNKRDYKDYFPTPLLQYNIMQPLNVTNNVGKYSITALIDGGGITGQAEALRLAMARALIEKDPSYRPALKVIGLLRRDPRMVERKKYGQKKARKRFQFSKR
ncbi:MAG: 30S ribosomal protein S9 [Bacteroidetes bacterium]|nr:30S ribosomal protein S9 [Bacteroidota bacterium]